MRKIAREDGNGSTPEFFWTAACWVDRGRSDRNDGLEIKQNTAANTTKLLSVVCGDASPKETQHTEHSTQHMALIARTMMAMKSVSFFLLPRSTSSSFFFFF